MAKLKISDPPPFNGIELTPIPEKIDSPIRRYTRREKVSEFGDFASYWKGTQNKGVVTHTISLSPFYEENVYKLISSGVIPEDLKSDTDIFEWILQRAFDHISGAVTSHLGE